MAVNLRSTPDSTERDALGFHCRFDGAFHGRLPGCVAWAIRRGVARLTSGRQGNACPCCRRFAQPPGTMPRAHARAHGCRELAVPSQSERLRWPFTPLPESVRPNSRSDETRSRLVSARHRTRWRRTANKWPEGRCANRTAERVPCVDMRGVAFGSFVGSLTDLRSKYPNTALDWSTANAQPLSVTRCSRHTRHEPTRPAGSSPPPAGTTTPAPQ